ncbi:hypothetical protein [Streptomyces resistomycificus]|uniref:Uncharacterized protein n=1 Tax=Streptomyces resistomycificus TaxID=67356 RepID=A0A0L8KVR5_9ACTN|nr:hypothetical protein [Streptomyces resistomycificus]KOG30058.1 hypothetical protein ADK37_35740 [Streptomyces resistomycificus]KUN94758.1 hypothetical protein AQJ84_25655 [Streptomyces resistomycificus]
MSTPMTTTLSDLTARTGLGVLDHLERQVAVPVVDGLQAQGDLIVVPFAFVADSVRLAAYVQWQEVPAAGIELLRSAAGGNPHSLVADPGTCLWTPHVFDDTRLALVVVDVREVAYLIHPEHGATGLAPGRYVVRRQRERNGERGQRMIAD